MWIFFDFEKCALLRAINTRSNQGRRLSHTIKGYFENTKIFLIFSYQEMGMMDVETIADLASTKYFLLLMNQGSSSLLYVENIPKKPLNTKLCRSPHKYF